MQKNIIETTEAPAAIGPYSQAVKTGNLLFVSGQIPLNPQTGTLITDGIEAETHQVMKNLQAILTAAGTTLEAVVKTTIFLKNMDDFANVNTVYASYFTGNYPARETVEVSRLPKDARVEISVVAAI
ncbi:MAG TPA: RidA family protein [Chitinophagales bacterium]|nr:RidA family protein [Chitinophagales bacterium]